MPEDQQNVETTEVVETPVEDTADEEEAQSYDFADDIEEDAPEEAADSVEETEPAEEAEPAEPAAPAEPQEPAVEAAPASEATPGPEDASQKAPEAVEPQEQQASPQTPADAAPAPQDWAERRQHWAAELQKEYMPSPEEFEKMVTDPAEFAAAGARLHMNVLESAVVAIRDALPALIEQHVSQRETSTSAEKAFFEKWPDLRGQDKLIATYTQAWNSQNPNATLEQRIEGVGKLVMFATGKTPTAPPPTVETPPAPPPPATPPHVGISATGGGVATPGVVNADEKMWAQVDAELFSDD